MTQMGRVIGRDPADIDTDRAGRGLQRLHGARFRIPQPHRDECIGKVAGLQESPPLLRCSSVELIPRSRRDQVLTALVLALVVTGLAVLIPTAAARLAALQPVPTPVPTPTPTAPPAAVLLS